MIGSFIRRILARLFGSGKEFEDFIMRIERGDIQYIVTVGVPTINPPEIPPPKSWKLPYVASGIDATSIILEDPEALLYILMSTVEGRRLRLVGPGDTVLRNIARLSTELASPIYVYSIWDNSEVRLIAAHGYITGAYYEESGRAFVGSQAVEKLAEMRFSNTFNINKIKQKIMEWEDDKLSVYIPGLDNQHKYLIATLNSLYHATISSQTQDVIEKILERLIQYTKFHFKSEEILMEKYEYPADRLERHIREHKGFVDAVLKFQSQYKAGEAQLTVQVFRFLSRWVQNHVMRTDRDYGIYLRDIIKQEYNI